MKAAFESMPYGRTSGTDFGPIDYIKYAEAFGATGLMINTPDDAAPVDRPEGCDCAPSVRRRSLRAKSQPSNGAAAALSKALTKVTQ